MNYDRSNPIDVLYEQDPKLDRYVDNVSGTSDIINKSNESPTVFGKSSVDRSTFFIGKDTNYPFITYFNNDTFDKLEVSEGTQVSLFKEGATAKNFLPNVKVGTVLDDLNKEHTNQEYLELEMSVLEGLNNDENPFSLNNVKSSTGKQVTKLVKACLPDSSFWNLPEHIGKVWKFTTNVRSEGGMFKSIESKNVTFSLALEPKETTASEGGSQQLGLEAAVRCRGGDNGWGWVLSPPPIFFDIATGQPYNPKDPKMMDLRSDWEVWYDHYGIWLEIGIGVAASFVGAGLAALIVRLGRAAGAAGTLFTFLSGTYGTTTRLSVFMQILTEGVMMAPIIKWQAENDRTADGILSTIFLLIPFVSETKAVSKFIGGKYSKEAANGVAEKIQKFGLEAIFKAGKDSPEASKKFLDFINSLTGTELALFNRGMAILAKGDEGMKAMKEGVEELVESGGKFAKEFEEAKLRGATETWVGKVSKFVGGSDNAVKLAGDISRTVAANVNPLTARWAIPFQFARMGVPIAVFATAFKSAYNELTEEEKVTFDNNLQKSLRLDEDYFIALNGIDPYLVEKIFNKQIEIITSDPAKTKAVLLSDEYLQSEEGKKVKDAAASEIIKEAQLTVEETKLLSNVLVTLEMKNAAMTACEEFLTKLGLTDINFTSSKDINNIIGTCFYQNTSYNFSMKKEGEKVNYYIGEKLVTDDEIKTQKWNVEGAKTTQKEYFLTKKNIIRNIYK